MAKKKDSKPMPDFTARIRKIVEDLRQLAAELSDSIDPKIMKAITDHPHHEALMALFLSTLTAEMMD